VSCAVFDVVLEEDEFVGVVEVFVDVAGAADLFFVLFGHVLLDALEVVGEVEAVEEVAGAGGGHF
jgi:hypothetical protein